jgi:toxin YoeB
MNKVFVDLAWADYLFWQTTDKKIWKKINALIRDIERYGNEGIGKPEALRHELSGYWSRRITEFDRIVYSIDQDTIYIISCRGHY